LNSTNELLYISVFAQKLCVCRRWSVQKLEESSRHRNFPRHRLHAIRLYIHRQCLARKNLGKSWTSHRCTMETLCQGVDTESRAVGLDPDPELGDLDPELGDPDPDLGEQKSWSRIKHSTPKDA